MTGQREAQLRRLAESYTAAWCSQNAASVAGFYSLDGSPRVNADPTDVGRDAISGVAEGFMAAFPHLKVIMDDIVVDGEQTEYRWTLVGTNTGPGGTGKRVHFSGFEDWRIGAEGLIAESRGHFDGAEYQRQLEKGVSGAPWTACWRWLEVIILKACAAENRGSGSSD